MSAPVRDLLEGEVVAARPCGDVPSLPALASGLAETEAWRELASRVIRAQMTPGTRVEPRPMPAKW